MGPPGNGITDEGGKFHEIANAYVAGPATFPTLGSANPSLTALSLTRRTARGIVDRAGIPAEAGFTPLSLAAADWKFVALDPQVPSGFRQYGALLESSGGYGLYFYTKAQFGNFVLRLEWRVARRDDNSGVFIRTPGAGSGDPLNDAVTKGHEIQIDQRGFDSATNSEGHAVKRTGAIYDLQAPSGFPSGPVGLWNRYEIEARDDTIRVTLNGTPVNVYQSTRQRSGYLAVQAYRPRFPGAVPEPSLEGPVVAGNITSETVA